jgi:hypothetical protein
MPSSQLDLWITGGAFTAKTREAYLAIVERSKAGPPLKSLPAAEQMRRAAVIKELSQGRPTLVLTDFKLASDADKALVRHVLNAAVLVESLFAAQSGVLALRGEAQALDPESRALFFRNQGPWCTAPATQNDPKCSALQTMPPKTSGLYPQELQQDKTFCTKLQKEKGDLMSPFTVEKKNGAGFEAVP